MHTLHTANQCHSNVALRAAPGGRARRQAAAAAGLLGKESTRYCKSAAQAGGPAAREGEAGGCAAREGKAVLLSALEVLLAAAAAPPRVSEIHSLSTTSLPPHLMMRTERAWQGDREGSERAGGETFFTKAGLRDEGRRAWAGPVLCLCVH